MPLTRGADVFLGISQDGVNRLLRHVVEQRPDVFNYATRGAAQRSELCGEPAGLEIAMSRGHAWITELPLLAVPPAGQLGLEYGVQITKITVDFHPDLDATDLTPCDPQGININVACCVCLGCPDMELVRMLAERLTSSPAPRYVAIDKGPT